MNFNFGSAHRALVVTALYLVSKTVLVVKVQRRACQAHHMISGLKVHHTDWALHDVYDAHLFFLQVKGVGLFIFLRLPHQLCFEKALPRVVKLRLLLLPTSNIKLH